MVGETVFTVTRLNEYASSVLKNDLRLRSIKVSGEISGFKNHSSGHLYFSLKDENAVVPCVMFRSSAAKLGFMPRDGMKVIVHGSASIYARDGKYQLYADGMKEAGEGELYRQFLMLKERLEAEGVFDNSRPLPALPRTIGVATSSAGAALHDIINIIRRRFPSMNILFAPCQVQGMEAPREICAAVRVLQRFEKCDVIIVGRGGGSYEDLSCFNDEGVARAIAASRVPVVSAVGHETDFTIADFAADLRAPTPSAAAELCCPLYDDMMDSVMGFGEDIKLVAEGALREAKHSLASVMSSAAMANPLHTVSIKKEKLNLLAKDIDGTAKTALMSAQARLEQRMSELNALSPESVMKRGYSIVTDGNGRIIKNASELEVDEGIGLRMFGGCAKAVVTEIN